MHSFLNDEEKGGKKKKKYNETTPRMVVQLGKNSILFIGVVIPKSDGSLGFGGMWNRSRYLAK